MAVGDYPVKACSQEVTYRDTVTLVGGVGPITDIGDPWYVFMLPRQNLSFNQTAGAIPANVFVEWAIADSATAGVPEWLPYTTIALVVGGLTPVNTLLTTGAVWLRFKVVGRNGDVVELACAAFL